MSESTAQPSHKLTYFNIQGVAEKVRLAFLLAGVDFVDERINHADWPELKKNCKYGALPILCIDGSEPISQSEAMLRYVGKLGDGLLSPSEPLAELRMNEVIGLTGDFDRAFAPSLYLSIRPTMYGLPEDYAKTPEGTEHVRRCRADFVANQLPKFLDHYADILHASGGPFFGGERPNLADCVILPQLAKFQAGFMDHIPVTSLDTHPVIINYINAMKAVPVIAAWYASK